MGDQIGQGLLWTNRSFCLYIPLPKLDLITDVFIRGGMTVSVKRRSLDFGMFILLSAIHL
jgi:hypothetical protein